MTTRTRILVAFAIGSLFGLAAGCQTYDFEPVEPLALAKTTQAKKVVSRNSKPNLMLVVDKSGSMLAPINTADSRCQAGGGVCGPGPTGNGTTCPANCPTRISELKLTMRGQNGNDGFLTATNSNQVARMGLGVFPNTTSNGTPQLACVPGKIIYDIVDTADDPTQLSAQAQQINTFIQSLSETAGSADSKIVGGTPTSASLAIVGNSASLNTAEREDFVLLLTDGLPNCNGGLDANSCTCTTGASPCTPSQNCLDDQATKDRIAALKARNIRTIVVGFGADLAVGSAAPVLNAMAEQGGMARNCLKVDGSRDPALCGTEQCDATTNLCTTRFYKATNAAELTAALVRITQIVTSDNPCEYKLDSTPSDDRLLQVTIDGQIVERGASTWTYTAGTPPKVTFSQNGTICPKLLSATPQAPVNLEISIIETL